MSQLRELSLGIVNDAYAIGLKYVKHQTLASFFTKIFKPRIDKIILKEAAEEDLKLVMWSMKKKMDKAIKLIDTAELINEGENLGSPKIPNIGELGAVKEFSKSDEQKAIELLKELKLC